MGTYFTDIAVGADADAVTFNDPLDELDAQLVLHNTEITNARGTMASIDARLNTALTDSGALKTGALLLQSQVALQDAAAVAGDAVRYNEYSTHTHTADFICVYGRSSESAAADTAAAAITPFVRTDADAAWVIYVRTAHWKRANVDALYLTGTKRNTSATLAGSIRLACDAEVAVENVVAGLVVATPFSLVLDISPLDDNDSHESTVSMQYAAGAGAATGQIELDDVQIWAYRTAAVPA